MSWGNAGNHSNVWLNNLTKRPYFTRMVHANLKNSKFGIIRHTRQAQWYTPVIIIAGDRGMSTPLKRQNSFKHFLSRSFTHRARYCDYSGISPRSSGPTQCIQALHNVFYNQQRCIFIYICGYVRN